MKKMLDVDLMKSDNIGILVLEDIKVLGIKVPHLSIEIEPNEVNIKVYGANLPDYVEGMLTYIIRVFVQRNTMHLGHLHSIEAKKNYLIENFKEAKLK
ncbi:MAG: hypothetical protein QXL94_05630 [Candidatus Parvarchaeum sp.]